MPPDREPDSPLGLNDPAPLRGTVEESPARRGGLGKPITKTYSAEGPRAAAGEAHRKIPLATPPIQPTPPFANCLLLIAALLPISGIFGYQSFLLLTFSPDFRPQLRYLEAFCGRQPGSPAGAAFAPDGVSESPQPKS